MFVSTPENAFLVPSGLGAPNAMYWRALSLATGAAWFIVTMRGAGEDGLLSTLLLVWDDDVVDTIRGFDGGVESLLAIVPAIGDTDRGSTCIRIHEVWLARADDADRKQCVIFVDQVGRQREGLFLDLNDEIVKSELILSIDKALSDAPS